MFCEHLLNCPLKFNSFKKKILLSTSVCINPVLTNHTKKSKRKQTDSQNVHSTINNNSQLFTKINSDNKSKKHTHELQFLSDLLCNFWFLISLQFPFHIWPEDKIKWNFCASIQFLEKALPFQKIIASLLVERTQVDSL